MALANRLFFRLYQCANMLHKTGTRAVAEEGLTTQQWAVLGAVSRPAAARGMGINELARYLMVSRQNLSGLVARMERAGHLQCESDPADGRSRLVQLTASGRALWQQRALPKIESYYGEVLAGFSINDVTHALHYLLKVLENMKRIDAPEEAGESAEGGDSGSADPLGAAGIDEEGGMPAAAPETRPARLKSAARSAPRSRSARASSSAARTTPAPARESESPRAGARARSSRTNPAKR
jgi:DNA-binding MarR family transcriptional regulator